MGCKARGITFNDILESLPSVPDGHAIWSNGSIILCRSEDAANAVADLIDALHIGEATTGFYDPEEDERNGEVDACTGFYYVDA